MSGAFIVAVPLGSTFTSKPPSLEVTVWAWESPFLMVMVVPGATDAGTLYAKSAMVMTASACFAEDDDEEDDAEGLLELDDDGMPIEDIELDVEDAPASGPDEPQADKPKATAGTMARRVILRVM